MSVSLYDISIPVLVRGLRTLSKLLDKGEAHAREQGLDPAALIGTRLFEDMLPLSSQVQLASDAAKGCVARLAGIEIPSFPDNEQSFAELQERIAKTIAFAESVDVAKFEGSETRTVSEPAAAQRSDRVHGPGLRDQLRAAELLFPRDHGLRHHASQGRAAQQAALPEPALSLPARGRRGRGMSRPRRPRRSVNGQTRPLHLDQEDPC